MKRYKFYIISVFLFSFFCNEVFAEKEIAIFLVKGLTKEKANKELFRVAKIGEPTKPSRAKTSSVTKTEEFSKSSLAKKFSVTKMLLEAGADVNARDFWKRTPLMWAAEKGHADIVKILLEEGADVNAKGITDQTALLLAIYKRHLNIVKLLIEAGADVNAIESVRGFTPLMWISAVGYTEFVEILLEAGADVSIEADILSGKSTTALMLAKRFRYTEIVNLIEASLCKQTLSLK